jgi:hypothetical protein
VGVLMGVIYPSYGCFIAKNAQNFCPLPVIEFDLNSGQF